MRKVAYCLQFFLFFLSCGIPWLLYLKVAFRKTICINYKVLYVIMKNWQARIFSVYELFTHCIWLIIKLLHLFDITTEHKNTRVYIMRRWALFIKPTFRHLYTRLDTWCYDLDPQVVYRFLRIAYVHCALCNNRRHHPKYGSLLISKFNLQKYTFFNTKLSFNKMEFEKLNDTIF